MENNGYKLIHTELKLDEKGIYRMDFEDMEKKLRKIKYILRYFAILIILVEESGKKMKLLK